VRKVVVIILNQLNIKKVKSIKIILEKIIQKRKHKKKKKKHVKKHRSNPQYFKEKKLQS
jgi:hypothetical protein